MATASPSISSTHSVSVEPGYKREPEVLEWERTSLTRVSRGWSRIGRETSIFLKSIGLGIIVSTYQAIFRKGFSEPKKVTIRRSRITSFFTSLIHVIPLAIALYEIVLNLRGRYVGEYFTQQAYYQLAAKAHEILIDASLSSIVLTYIRRELTNGDGLPFGAFLASLQFLSVSYLWSRELWSSTLSKSYGLRKSITFFFFIIVCGIIAATAGPSSATLLIPRQMRWKVEPSYVLLNGTFEEIWPDRLDPLQIPEECALLDQSDADPVCPGSDWQAIQNELSQLTDYYGAAFGDNDSEEIATLDNYYFEIPGYQQTVKNGEINVCTVFEGNLQVCGDVVPLVVVTAAFNDTILWKDPPGLQSYADIYHTIDQGFFQAYSAIQCVPDMAFGVNDSDPLQFPRLSRTLQEYESPTELISLTNLTKGSLYSTLGNFSEFRLLWTELPEFLFGSHVSGAIILNPRSSAPGSPQNFTICSFGAGFGTSSASTDLTNLGEVFSQPVNLPSSFAQLNAGADQGVYGIDESFADPIFANISGFNYPQRPLELPLAWLSYLNPTISLQDGVNTTAINVYMSTLPDDISVTVVANVITYMLLLGISSQGVDIPWQTLPDGPIPCTDCYIVKINHAYQGWAYLPNETPVNLAIAVMITYCTLAVAHIIYLLSTGLSSDAWDSAAEVITLAMNSSPTEHLKNTCSGIIGMKPFRTRVRIIATSNVTGVEDDHLELVFGEKSEAETPEVEMQIDQEYGSLPAKPHQD